MKHYVTLTMTDLRTQIVVWNRVHRFSRCNQGVDKSDLIPHQEQGTWYTLCLDASYLAKHYATFACVKGCAHLR